jgi:hypothetical protein
MPAYNSLIMNKPARARRTAKARCEMAVTTFLTAPTDRIVRAHSSLPAIVLRGFLRQARDERRHLRELSRKADALRRRILKLLGE